MVHLLNNLRPSNLLVAYVVESQWRMWLKDGHYPAIENPFGRSAPSSILERIHKLFYNIFKILVYDFRRILDRPDM